MIARRALLATTLLPLAAPTRAAPATKLRLGQATTAVSFLPIMAARALNTFAAHDLDLDWAAIPGGDPSCLAALDSGDIDIAAVGSDTLLNAIAKGQPFQMVASCMSKVSLELVVSNKLIERTGTAPADDPLPKRLAALKGAVIGVGGIGGAQDRAARWLARQAGLDPRTDIQVAMAGPPPAIQAALEAGRIDAYILSPPEGLLSEDARTGQVLIRMGDEFKQLKNVPFLVLAIKTPIDPARHALIVQAIKALQSACTQLLANPQAVAAKIHDALYPRIKAPVMQAAILGLKSGIETRGRLEEAGVNALVTYAGDAAQGLDAAKGTFWTNKYWDEAAV